MNSFYQLNSSAVLLQSIVLVTKLIENDNSIMMIPQFISISIGLYQLHIYKKHKDQHLIIYTILLVNLLFINTVQPRQEIIGYAKYLLIGRFMLKYHQNKLLTHYSQNKIILTEICHQLLILCTFIIESVVYQNDIEILICIIVWFIIFFPIPRLIWTESKQIKQEKAQDDLTIIMREYNLEKSSLKRSERILPQYYPDKQVTKNQFPSEFYNQMLKQYPEGILILSSECEEVFISDSVKKIMSVRERDKHKMVELILSLRNCQNEMKQQEKVNHMFQALQSKLSSQDQQSQLEIDVHSALSESETVGQEFDRIMGDMRNHVEHSSSENTFEFLFEVTMICAAESGHVTLSSVKTLFEVAMRPFIYQRTPYLFMIIKDVTHFNQIRVLQAMNQNKSQMLAQVSHEFRTPLNCIILLVELLQEQVDPAISEEFLQPILISSKTLLSLINDLLDVAQLRAGKFKLVNMNMDLRNLFEETRKFLLPQLQQKSNQFILKIGNFDTNITSDPNRIRQVVFNLIINANKFTQKGHIELQVDRTLNDLFKVTVRDTGSGIDQKDFNKLFQAFGKLETNKDLNAQGVGLGLLISNVLAEKLSSSEDSTHQPQGLQVQSDGLGKGSSFSFFILDQTPYTNSSKYQIVLQESRRDTEIQRQKTKLDRQFMDIKQDLAIMIVDDEGFNIMAITKALSKKFTVEGYYSGADIIARMSKPLPLHTIVLQDIEMPDMDGFETAKSLKKINQDLYIIGCSGHDETMKEKCLASGMDNYLQKPVHLTELMRIIDQLF